MLTFSYRSLTEPAEAQSAQRNQEKLISLCVLSVSNERSEWAVANTLKEGRGVFLHAYKIVRAQASAQDDLSCLLFGDEI